MRRTVSLLATFLHILAYNRCFTNTSNKSTFEIPDMDDPKEFLYHELSADAYFSLPCHEKNDTAPTRRLGKDSHAAYKILKPDEWEFEITNSEPALQPPAEVVDSDRYNWYNQYIKKKETLHEDTHVLLHLCYAVSYIWRRGRKGIHRYYNLRDTYSEHVPFEIGYITQVIMAKYQNVLELYELSTRMEGPDNKIGRPHLYFFYKNILEDCRSIIHLCNMMHEVTRKYRIIQYSAVGQKWIDVGYEPSHKFQDRTGHKYIPRAKDEIPYFERDYERGIEGLEHEKFRHEDPAIFETIKQAGMIKQREKQRLYQKAKPYRQFFLDHGHFTMTATPSSRRTRRWRPKDPLEYGWSEEKK